MNTELEQQAREWLNSEGYMHLGLRLTKRGHNGDSDLPERVLAAFAAHLEAQSKPIQGEVPTVPLSPEMVEKIMEVVDPCLDWSGGPLACKHRRIDLRTRLLGIRCSPGG